MKNLDKLNKILCELFEIKDVEDLKDELGPDEIEGWDSMAHIELVLKLEEGFDISLEVIDVSRMYTIGDIKKILGKYEVEL
ncbi:acyl carrier protein [Clostridium sardiniense]|uniref:Acyl carrier protein n=1 Tax=Clostridium sardiniense TaxID=29369 RepID=A0ABS7KWR2_CLOSR|nr:acyl carrier protein [Clostridium sardiniense]MBM7834603.1 acyl carrier protein [Clostridium sardiniense]MBY0755258.1 acyl carrier protein [Clostridium sardiniense]MDQ0459701.1 acyl carrier protein [Clostridium sardiniense]